MKKIVLISIVLAIYSGNLFGQQTAGNSSKGKIIGGCLINTLGVVLIYESIHIANNPIYNYYEGGKNDQKTKSILAAGIGVVCLTVGTLNIIKGVKLGKREVNMDVSLTGIRLIYKI
jgi:putative Mn2+ efflux pump MntP